MAKSHEYTAVRTLLELFAFLLLLTLGVGHLKCWPGFSIYLQRTISCKMEPNSFSIFTSNFLKNGQKQRLKNSVKWQDVKKMIEFVYKNFAVVIWRNFSWALEFNWVSYFDFASLCQNLGTLKINLSNLTFTYFDPFRDFSICKMNMFGWKLYQARQNYFPPSISRDFRTWHNK